MKKIIFYSSLIWLLNFSHSKAQCNFSIDSLISDDTLLDVGNKVVQDYIGNYVTCGRAWTQGGAFDGGYLVKTTHNGVTIWKKKFDLTIYADNFNDIKILPDKSYIILGTTSSTVNVNHVFIANLDTNGTLLWYNQFTYPEYETASQIQITNDNKLLILGYSKNYLQSTGDVLLIKTDISGNLIWRKIIGLSTVDENYTSLQIINNNTNYLIVGTERPASKYNLAVTILDTSGTVIWNKLNGTASLDFYGSTICQTFDKGYFVGGKINTQGYVWKLDSTGTIQWSNPYGLNTFTIIKEVKQLSDSNLVFITNDNYLHSSSNSVKAGILTKIDKNGNLLWEKFYKRPSAGQQIVGINGFNFTKDNGYIITGSVVNTFGAPYTNLWLIKTDSLGNDSSNCAFYNSVKEITISNLAFEIFPNPTNSILNIIDKQNQIKDATIEIKNYLGQVVFVSTFNNQINLSNLSEGMYFLVVKNEQIRTVIKFIKN